MPWCLLFCARWISGFFATRLKFSNGRNKQNETDNEIIGESDVWLKTLDAARQIAETDSLACLEGETGSGKGMLANYIHRHSSREEKPYIVVDCGAVPEHRLEPENFRI